MLYECYGICKSGPSCSKLTTLLVNDSLKFTSSDMQIRWNFLLKKCEKLLQCKSYSHFFRKNIRILYTESAKTVNKMTLNELVKLTMLWTTGPRFIHNTNCYRFHYIRILDKLLWIYTSCSYIVKTALRPTNQVQTGYEQLWTWPLMFDNYTNCYGPTYQVHTVDSRYLELAYLE